MDTKSSTLILFACFLKLIACVPAETKKIGAGPNLIPNEARDSLPPLIPYADLKEQILKKKKELAGRYAGAYTSSQAGDELIDFWVNTLSVDMYEQWKGTPWDFNGTSTLPRQGNIACGYFVTTILRDMDLKINRVKLAVCASSEMMKALVPRQRLRNLSHLSYTAFNDTLKMLGKGVYIIGLDYHTGFIVHDGNESWFIHSNYIERKGVTKEAVKQSSALQVSKTRWLVTLTSDKTFLKNWLAK